MSRTLEFATKIIKLEEESNVFKPKPYYCSKFYPTIGWGFLLINTPHAPLPDVTMTIEEGNAKLERLVGSFYKNLSTHIDTAVAFNKLNDARQAIILSACYQLGFVRLLGFKQMWIALFAGDYNKAALEMLDSEVAREIPIRWHRNAEQMRTGELNVYYK
jgi:GH24 family phage-related lysozyme (muramidase)